MKVFYFFPYFDVGLLQALSSGYQPIGAVMVSPEITEVIHSKSNQLGMLRRKKKLLAMNYFLILVV